MTQAIVSIVINIIVALMYSSRDDISEGFRSGLVLVLGGFILLSAIGLAGYVLTRKKGFAVVSMIGFGVFVPIGLIGIFGMAKLMKANSPAATGIPAA